MLRYRVTSGFEKNLSEIPPNLLAELEREVAIVRWGGHEGTNSKTRCF
jgi:hypothetical protein